MSEACPQSRPRTPGAAAIDGPGLPAGLIEALGLHAATSAHASRMRQLRVAPRPLPRITRSAARSAIQRFHLDTEPARKAAALDAHDVYAVGPARSRQRR